MPSRKRSKKGTNGSSSSANGSSADVYSDESTRKADDELTRLSILSGIDEDELLVQLEKKRKTLKDDPRKARLIDELLTHATVAKRRNDRNNNNNSNDDPPPSPPLNNNNNNKRSSSPVVRPNRPSSSSKIPRTAEEAAAARRRTDDSVVDRSILSGTLFQDLPGLHPASLRAVEDVLGLRETTEVQAKTFQKVSEGKDVLARARTGTGKTLAFLLPSLEVVLKNRRSDGRNANDSIEILVVSPTRELASQIHGQAEKMLSFHDASLTAQVVYGGTKIGGDVAKFVKRTPTILVATPGRLLDHLSSTRVKSRSFAECLSNVKVLVLDETDRLLDMGFRKEIRDIINRLGPARDRQTLLFSATLPPELRSVMEDTMRKNDSVTVDCVKDDGAHTNALIEQKHVVMSSLDDYVSDTVRTVLKAANSAADSKVVAFFPTARAVGFFANVFNKRGDLPDVVELHSKKSQGFRNKASDAFRNARTAVMFTSDVSARGVDYPDVTHVLQFGLPESREQYIHRLGRTGRAGKVGQGWLVLAPFERRFLQEIKDLNVAHDPDLLSFDGGDDETKRKLPTDRDSERSATMAYQAFLGYYLGNLKRTSIRSKEELVETANQLPPLMGLKEIPSLEKRLVGKMGLKGVPGVRVGSNEIFNKQR